MRAVDRIHLSQVRNRWQADRQTVVTLRTDLGLA